MQEGQRKRIRKYRTEVPKRGACYGDDLTPNANKLLRGLGGTPFEHDPPATLGGGDRKRATFFGGSVRTRVGDSCCQEDLARPRLACESFHSSTFYVAAF